MAHLLSPPGVSADVRRKRFYELAKVQEATHDCIALRAREGAAAAALLSGATP